jgi:hypothetical protein
MELDLVKRVFGGNDYILPSSSTGLFRQWRLNKRQDLLELAKQVLPLVEEAGAEQRLAQLLTELASATLNNPECGEETEGEQGDQCL